MEKTNELFLKERLKIIKEAREPEDLTELEFKKAIELNPKDAEFRYMLGRAIINQGRYPEAGAVLTEALELAKKNEDKSYIYFLLARKSLLQEIYDEAERYLEKAKNLLELKPQTRELFESIIQYSSICKLLKDNKLEIESVRLELELEKPFEDIITKGFIPRGPEKFAPEALFAIPRGKSPLLSYHQPQLSVPDPGASDKKTWH